MALYVYVLSIVMIFFVHHLSERYVLSEKNGLSDVPLIEVPFLDDSNEVHRFCFYCISQLVICSIVTSLLKLKRWHRFLLLGYTLPLILRFVGFPTEDLLKVHHLAYIFTIMTAAIFLWNNVPGLVDDLRDQWNEALLDLNRLGWFHTVFSICIHLIIPIHFLLFWIVLFVMKLYSYAILPGNPFASEGWTIVVLASIAECCVTPVSLIGACITVAYLSSGALTCARVYLHGWAALVQNENVVLQNGWVEGFTMFLLCIQTGIIELKLVQRAFLMGIIMFIVIASLVQSLFELTEPVLLSLPTSLSHNVLRHVRTVAFCLLLGAFASAMTYCICMFLELDFWLLVVVSSCVLTSIQVTSALIVYSLFLYDALRENSWESLDDIVYYAKATTRVLEFIVAVIVVAYGIIETVFGDWDMTNSVILSVHCYFNVWLRLQTGWKNYTLRRQAVQRIASLPEATEAEIRAYSDVCAICYQSMASARVIPCHHLFHGVCLRKWLYVQDTCPLCHRKVELQPSTTVSTSAETGPTPTSDAAAAPHDLQDNLVEGDVQQ